MRNEWIGKSRAVQAEKSINEINPEVEVEIYDERTSEANIDKLLKGAHIALSARPNFHEAQSSERGMRIKGGPFD